MKPEKSNINIADILKVHRNLGGSPEAYAILFFNLLVLFFVIFYPEDKYIVVAAYFLETLIIGMFNVVKMVIITMFNPTGNDRLGNDPAWKSNVDFKSPVAKNMFLIIFFIFHFGLFYFVQLVFLNVLATGFGSGFPAQSSFFPNPFTFFPAALGKQGVYIILTILAVQFFSFFYSFLIREEYKVTSCTRQGMQPYGRILVQQFVVIIGSFFIIIIQHAIVFSILLVLFKTFIDLYIFRRMDNKMADQPAKESDPFGSNHS